MPCKIITASCHKFVSGKFELSCSLGSRSASIFYTGQRFRCFFSPVIFLNQAIFAQYCPATNTVVTLKENIPVQLLKKDKHHVYLYICVYLWASFILVTILIGVIIQGSCIVGVDISHLNNVALPELPVQRVLVHPVAHHNHLSPPR